MSLSLLRGDKPSTESMEAGRCGADHTVTVHRELSAPSLAFALAGEDKKVGAGRCNKYIWTGVSAPAKI